MRNGTMLNDGELNHLKDCLEYLLLDDKEKIDFIQQLEDNGYTALLWQLFPSEYDEVLQLRLVPVEMRNHIYFKTQSLYQELRGVIYGG